MFHPALAFAQFAISIFFISAGLLAQGRVEPGGIIGNTYLTFICMGGSGIGGFLYVVMNSFTIKAQETSGVRALKFICSFFIGLVFAAWIIPYMGWDQTPGNVFAISCLAGLLGWGVLMTMMPWAATFIPTLIKTVIGMKTGIDPEQPPKS